MARSAVGRGDDLAKWKSSAVKSATALRAVRAADVGNQTCWHCRAADASPQRRSEFGAAVRAQAELTLWFHKMRSLGPETVRPHASWIATQGIASCYYTEVNAN